MRKSKIVQEYLNKIIPAPDCELHFENNFQLLVAVILSAQCTDKRVNQVTGELFKKYKTPQDFVNLGQEGLEKEIKSCGFYHNKAKNIIECSKKLIENYNGVVSDNFEDLTSLAGVGRKTANVVLSVAFDVPAIAVDTHVFRVSNRIGLVEANTPEKVEEGLKKQFNPKDWKDMHHSLVLFGRYYCKAISPKCAECELKKICKYYNDKVK